MIHGSFRLVLYMQVLMTILRATKFTLKVFTGVIILSGGGLVITTDF